jgi:hypothetical protein
MHAALPTTIAFYSCAGLARAIALYLVFRKISPLTI